MLLDGSAAPSPACTIQTDDSTALTRMALRFDDGLEEDPYEMEMQIAAELAPREQQLPDEL